MAARPPPPETPVRRRDPHRRRPRLCRFRVALDRDAALEGQRGSQGYAETRTEQGTRTGQSPLLSIAGGRPLELTHCHTHTDSTPSRSGRPDPLRSRNTTSASPTRSSAQSEERSSSSQGGSSVSSDSLSAPLLPPCCILYFTVPMSCYDHLHCNTFLSPLSVQTFSVQTIHSRPSSSRSKACSIMLIKSRKLFGYSRCSEGLIEEPHSVPAWTVGSRRRGRDERSRVDSKSAPAIVPFAWLAKPKVDYRKTARDEWWRGPCEAAGGQRRGSARTLVASGFRPL